MPVPDDIRRAEQVLGLTFSDPAILEAALTHPSLVAERGGQDYQRLEFLGDSVVGLIVAAHVFKAFPELYEGDLTRMKTSAVRGGALAHAARAMGVASLLRLGKGAGQSGEQERDSVLEDAMEAIIGAVFLDGGLAAARAFVERALGERLSPVAMLETIDDPKTRLQELAQARGLGLPAYRDIGQEGAPHQRTFFVEVVLGEELAGKGAGRTKREAGQHAAAEALAKLSAP